MRTAADIERRGRRCDRTHRLHRARRRPRAFSESRFRSQGERIRRLERLSGPVRWTNPLL